MTLDDWATVTIDGLGARSTSYFDAAGNLTGTRDANGNLTQYLIDADERTPGTPAGPPPLSTF